MTILDVVTPEMFTSPVNQTPEEWCHAVGVAMMGPDGWLEDHASWKDPIPLAVFMDRLLRSNFAPQEKRFFTIARMYQRLANGEMR